MRDPVLWGLVVSTVATLLLLLDRRAKNRLHVLDIWLDTRLSRWAEQHQLNYQREPPLNVLAPFEPLGLVGPVVAVQRLLQGRVATPVMAMDAWLCAVLCGNRPRPHRYLIALLASHPELPPLRALPAGDREAPRNLGFTPLPASAIPAGYEAEGFQPLSRTVTAAVGEALRAAGPGFRVELRPGRLLVAVRAIDADTPDRLMDLALRLNHALYVAMEPPETPEPEAGPPPVLN